ncbi:cysteine peptidase family C39 domain-containing protein [Streptomyces sp. NPDC058773]|uniref:cysteine peptidase family C39 domain-containing protein n=1 Tax=Streptomyces sp. NPDC058773 TaxID=3346632 RepID=UPI00368286C7
MKWQRYHAHQEGETDCGPACMRMVLNRHGVVVDTATLRESAGLGHGGASLLRLRDVLAGYGVEPLLLRVSPGELRTAVRKSGPAIAVMKEEGLLHFVVVHEVRSDGQLIVSDPVRYRPAVVSLERFAEWFNGEVLVTDTPQRKLTIRSTLQHARRNSVVWQIAAERKRSLLVTGLITAVTAVLLIAVKGHGGSRRRHAPAVRSVRALQAEAIRRSPSASALTGPRKEAAASRPFRWETAAEPFGRPAYLAFFSGSGSSSSGSRPGVGRLNLTMAKRKTA